MKDCPVADLCRVKNGYGLMGKLGCAWVMGGCHALCWLPGGVDGGMLYDVGGLDFLCGHYVFGPTESCPIESFPKTKVPQP